MHKVLITGENSYIGRSFMEWVKNNPDIFVEEVSTKDGVWKQIDFSKFDSIFHVAGIAHVSTDSSLRDDYYNVNTNLTLEVAKKAKQSGVKQFIFMSSIIVYGDGSIQDKVITKDTIPDPSNFYGDSKLQAEKGLRKLESDNFKVAILRPPMIYGKGSKGNYPKLSKLAQFSPIFPKFINQRSMLHIDNLCEFLRLIVINQEKGVFFPQNSEYVNTSEMVKMISNVHNKKIILTPIFNPLIKLLFKNNLVNKVFGNLTYDKNLSEYIETYQIVDLYQSIERTEAVN